MGTTSVVVGSLLAALLAYAFQVFGGRMVGPVEFAPITIIWTVQFLAMQVLYQPLEHFVNRETGLHRPPAINQALLFGIASGIVTATTMYLLRDLFFDRLSFVIMAGVLVFGYAVFGYVRGRLAGANQFGAFGIVTAGEAGLRLALAISLVWTMGALGLAWAMVIAPFVAIAWIPQAGVRGPRAEFARNLTPLVAASAFGQALLGLPPLAAAFFGADAATVSVVFMTFAMYRGPIWVLQGLMARLLPVFVDRVEQEAFGQLRQWMGRLASGGLAVASLAFVVGFVLGPPVLGWLLGEGFRPDSLFSGMTAAGVVIAATAGLMNQVLLALDRLHAITYSWLIGLLVAAIVAIWLPGSPYFRIGSGFLVGEIVALSGLFTRFLRMRFDGLTDALAPETAASLDPRARP